MRAPKAARIFFNLRLIFMTKAISLKACLGLYGWIFMNFRQIGFVVFVVSTLFISGGATAQSDDELVIVTRTPNGPVVNPADNPQLSVAEPSEEQKLILAALNQVENLGTEINELITLIANAKQLQDLEPPVVHRIEAEILAYIKPLPASDTEANMSGYAALANLNPGNATYSEKRDGYANALKQEKLAILKKYKAETDDFNGVTWYKHKSQPRYTDIRPFISLYLGQKDGQKPILRFVLNYTADSWLFVESAQINIDGTIVDIPSSNWQRDNDSEIWEWIDEYANESYIELAKRISKLKKAVVRFNGQQYFDNYTVRDADREVLRDGLLAFDVMSSESK